MSAVPGPEVRRMGESALLAEFADSAQTLQAYRMLRAAARGDPAHHGVLELVPAARTVLVVIDSRRVGLVATEAWLRSAISDPASGSATASAGGVDARRPRHDALELTVRYDGPDLGAVADLLGVTVDDVIDLHTGGEWTSAFIGFAPGFAYLTASDSRLTVPRRSSPRAAVPAGSVALAAGYCGVYPARSPGGWQIIGHTDAPLWNPEAAEPALLAPGTVVRFVRAR
ncbi:allophanate hydrolase subunit 1 [Herbiconiux sp. A18JL235]|uniref:Allophanate hydrolase subunit 1 n=1 Tax=Herbiconiux sp. A18JL235 TaxID=3152363 RepID=A0AB39BBL8_9MICO